MKVWRLDVGATTWRYRGLGVRSGAVDLATWKRRALGLWGRAAAVAMWSMEVWSS